MGIAAAVGSFIVGNTFGGAIARLVLTTAASTLLARAALPSRPGVVARTITSRGTVDPEAIIYGEAVIGGTLAYRNVHGTNNRDLWGVHCLAGHQCEAILDAWLDDKQITNAQINNGDPAGGIVTSGDFGPVGDRGDSAVAIFKQLGTDTQAALLELVNASPQWTTNHRLRGITYAATRFSLWDKTEALWQAGDPNNVRFLVRGKRIYDPRQDSTNGGTGSQRADDATTWTWSQNPALCVIDLLRDAKFSPLIGGIPSAKIDWPAVITAANHCDETVPVPGGTQPRFTCNGVVYGSSSPEDNVTAIMSAMNGTLVFSNGLYTILAGEYVAPTDSLSEADIIGPISYTSALSSDNRVNTIKATYIDRDKLYEPTETAAITIAALKDTRDGGRELISSIELPMTDTWYEAQRLCLKRLTEANQEATLTVPCNLRAARLVPGQRVNVTINERGWNPKVFKVLKWRLADQGGNQIGVNVELREDDASAYADPAEGDYNTLSPGGVLQIVNPALIPSVDTIPRNIEYGVGTWSIRLTPNVNQDNSPNPGEIRVGPGRFLLPDGAIRTVATQAQINTPWEGADLPPDTVFYLIWGDEPLSTRFPGRDYPASSGSLGLFSGIYDRFNDQWYAVDNVNVQDPFTPLASDYVIARGTRSTTSASGIENLTAVVPFVTDSVLTGTAVGLIELTPRADATLTDNVADPADATVTITAGINRILSGPGGVNQTWLTTGDAVFCDVRCDVVSGTVTGDPTGIWLPFVDVDFAWTRNQTTPGTAEAVVDIQFREQAEPTNTTTARYTLQATVTAAKPVLAARSNDTFATTVTDPANAVTRLEVRTDGNLVEQNNGVDGTSQTWLTSGNASNCEVRFTLLSGSISSGTLDTWLPMSELQAIVRNRTIVGSSSCEIRVDIREPADPANLTSADYVLGATVLSS